MSRDGEFLVGTGANFGLIVRRDGVGSDEIWFCVYAYCCGGFFFGGGGVLLRKSLLVM